MKINDAILKIKNLNVEFPLFGGIFQREVSAVHAVKNVSLDIPKGKTIGVVGESGSGKSTLGKAIIRMIVRDIIQEPLDLHTSLTKIEKKEKIDWLLEKVGLNKEQANRYPHEFSGGQRQRIGIARALATEPEIIIADEPVSALDVSIQAQVINLMMDLQEEFNLTIIFIAHDLSVVKHISSHVAVMYLGEIVEYNEVDEIFNNPRHEYTKTLLTAIPQPNPKGREERKKERLDSKKYNM